MLDILRRSLDDPSCNIYIDKQWQDLLSAVETCIAASHSVPDQMMTEWHQVRAEKVLKLNRITIDGMTIYKEHLSNCA